MEFTTVFDLAVSGYKAWTFPALGSILVFVGLLLALFPGLLPTPWPWTQRGIRIFGWLFFAFASLWTGFSFWTTYGEYLDLADRLATGRYEVIAGTVDNYEQDRSEERFTVGGVPFSYSDFRASSAFNNTAAQGGPIRSDLYVRITHADGAILRLEIRK